MTNVTKLLTKLSIVLTSCIILLGTAPSAFADECTCDTIACALAHAYVGLRADECGKSESDDAAVIVLALVGGGALIYFAARDKSDKERLIMYRNFLQGNGIRVTGDHSKLSVSLMLLGHAGAENSGLIRRNFDGQVGETSFGVDLIKVNF